MRFFLLYSCVAGQGTYEGKDQYIEILLLKSITEINHKYNHLFLLLLLILGVVVVVVVVGVLVIVVVLLLLLLLLLLLVLRIG